jgi:hypothetical protein
MNEGPRQNLEDQQANTLSAVNAQDFLRPESERVAGAALGARNIFVIIGDSNIMSGFDLGGVLAFEAND